MASGCGSASTHQEEAACIQRTAAIKAKQLYSEKVTKPLLISYSASHLCLTTGGQTQVFCITPFPIRVFRNGGSCEEIEREKGGEPNASTQNINSISCIYYQKTRVKALSKYVCLCAKKLLLIYSDGGALLIFQKIQQCGFSVPESGGGLRVRY